MCSYAHVFGVHNVARLGLGERCVGGFSVMFFPCRKACRSASLNRFVMGKLLWQLTGFMLWGWALMLVVFLRNHFAEFLLDLS